MQWDFSSMPYKIKISVKNVIQQEVSTYINVCQWVKFINHGITGIIP